MLSAAEFEALFRYFDKNNDGVLCSCELINGIRGFLNPARQQCVNEVWQRMCYGESMSIQECEKFYQSKNVSESFSEMISQMDANDDHMVTKCEFSNYYLNISPCFNKDTDFQNFLYCSWGLN